ncbi:putative endopeptidase p60 precursor [mine drainage metagenome]|uniref:Putative endopeptidase p60 n=1 Tax=mine drainage metagenome TaxID=410659 RepID=A0A1J5QEM6_9ZZZZ
MIDSTTGARHRAARRPVTPLTDFANAATGSMATVGRRTAVVAASSGLVVSMLASPAAAAPSSEAASASVPSVDTAALTDSTQWTFDLPEVTAVAAPVKQRTVRTVSRSSVRTVNAPIPQSVSGNAVLEIAARYVGVPYRYGGTTPAGFDCSGFTQYVYAQLGIHLPRTDAGQHYAGTIISRADALPGDIIWTPGHVAIYAGGNMEIDAPVTGMTVQFRSIWQSSPVFIRMG